MTGARLGRVRELSDDLVEVLVEELAHVWSLPDMNAAPGEWGDLDVEDVGERPLVLRLPRGLDVADETRVERVGDEVPSASYSASRL